MNLILQIILLGTYIEFNLPSNVSCEDAINTFISDGAITHELPNTYFYNELMIGYACLNKIKKEESNESRSRTDES